MFPGNFYPQPFVGLPVSRVRALPQMSVCAIPDGTERFATAACPEAPVSTVNVSTGSPTLAIASKAGPDPTATSPCASKFDDDHRSNRLSNTRSTACLDSKCWFALRKRRTKVATGYRIVLRIGVPKKPTNQLFDVFYWFWLNIPLPM